MNSKTVTETTCQHDGSCLKHFTSQELMSELQQRHGDVETKFEVYKKEHHSFEGKLARFCWILLSLAVVSVLYLLAGSLYNHYPWLFRTILATIFVCAFTICGVDHRRYKLRNKFIGELAESARPQ